MWTNNPDTNAYTKHVDTKYFKIRDYIRQLYLRVAYIPTHMNVADFFTKALDYKAFNKFRTHIGVSI